MRGRKGQERGGAKRRRGEREEATRIGRCRDKQGVPLLSRQSVQRSETPSGYVCAEMCRAKNKNA